MLIYSSTMFLSTTLKGDTLGENCTVEIDQHIDSWGTCIVDMKVIGECASTTNVVWVTPNGAFTNVPTTNTALNASVAGTYTVFVTLSDGCVLSSSITVSSKCQTTEAPECECSVELEQYEDSWGTCIANVIIAGDCEIKNIVWISPNGAATDGIHGINASEPGKYYAIIIFADGCQVQACIVVTDDCKECEFDIELDHDNTLCISENGAVAVVGHPAPGLVGFTYSWQLDGVDFGTPTSVLTNIGPGTYSVTVTDPLGCIATGSVTVLTVESTIIWATGGDTGLAPGTNPIQSGILLEEGQLLKWTFSPQNIPDRIVIEWAPTSNFNTITTLLDTGPVTSRGTDCIAGTSYENCLSLLHIHDFPAGSDLPVDGTGGPGIDILVSGTATSHLDNSADCPDFKKITGCLKLADEGFVRMILDQNTCDTEGTVWSLTVDCGCTKTNDDYFINVPQEKVEPMERDVNWIYPNPSQGVINFNSTHEINEVEVYDNVGKLVSQKSGLLKSLDLEFLNPGVYIVKMKGSFGDKTQKIVIQ